MTEYDADDIRAAFAAALGPDASDDPVVRELQAPDGLATAVALELAHSTSVDRAIELMPRIDGFLRQPVDEPVPADAADALMVELAAS